MHNSARAASRPCDGMAPRLRAQAVMYCPLPMLGLTSGEAQRLEELERENRELKRANEILRKASTYVAQAQIDRRPK